MTALFNMGPGVELPWKDTGGRGGCGGRIRLIRPQSRSAKVHTYTVCTHICMHPLSPSLTLSHTHINTHTLKHISSPLCFFLITLFLSNFLSASTNSPQTPHFPQHFSAEPSQTKGEERQAGLFSIFLSLTLSTFFSLSVSLFLFLYLLAACG